MRRLQFSRMLAVCAAALFALVPLACGGNDTFSSEDVSFDTHDGDPDWSPDGRLIAFSSNRGRGGIYTIRPDGTALRLVFSGTAEDPDWSPDGRWLAFASKDGLYVVRADGTDARRVLRGAAISRPAWAPSGRDLAFVKEESDLSSAIYVVRLDGGRSRRLLPRYQGAVGDARPGSVAATSETEPAWSADGRRMVFQAGEGFLVIANVTDGRRRTIVRGRAYAPAWSPDGKLIAYGCEGDLCVAAADGSGGVHQIAKGGGDASWAPDSRRVVFEHYLYGGTHFFSSPQSLSVADAAAGGTRKLTFGPSTPPVAK